MSLVAWDVKKALSSGTRITLVADRKAAIQWDLKLDVLTCYLS